MLRRLHPLWPLKKAIRRNSTDESVNYAFRKEIITKSPAQFYPPISLLRGKEIVTRVPDFIRNYGSVDYSTLDNKRHPDILRVEGRVKSIRKAGKAMYFMDIIQDDSELQVCASNRLTNTSVEQFSQKHAFIRKGDHVSCMGHPSLTNTNELTLKATVPIEVVSPCLNSVTLPNRVQDRKVINANRVMNYLVNPALKGHIRVKSLVTQAIRNFFIDRNFMEVLTPQLAGAGTGANAEPFHTSLRALGKLPLQLRVAPELWLKKLVIAGFDKVFEIGTNFRNEGIDATHNPEFLACEFYQSHTSLSDLMEMTENLLRHVHQEISKHARDIGDVLMFPGLSERLTSLAPLAQGSYPRYDFIESIERITGEKLPVELTSENLIAFLLKLGILPPATKSPAVLLDLLSSTYLELISEKTHNMPIFIYNQPAIMSPLAKSTHRTYDGREFEISLRFEMFINGKEYVNSYEEENSPFAQAEKFRLQQRDGETFNDHDALLPDWNYVRQMELGLPPTGGWGCGIDRLAMLFSGAKRIEDVLPFGSLRDVVRQ